MELNVRKFNAHISTNCEIIKQCHTELTDVLSNYECSNLNRAEIDRALVRMSVASRRVLDLVADARMTPLEFVKSMVRSNLAEIEDKAQAILDMIRSGRITVIDVKLDEDEELD